MEAKRLITERQMLTSEIEIVTKEIHKFSGDNSNLPELVAELDGLRKEHHSLRFVIMRNFEHFPCEPELWNSIGLY